MRYLLYLVGFLVVRSAVAIQYPIMTSAEITACETLSYYEGECNYSVWYAGTSAVVEIGDPVASPPGTSLLITPYGVHCYAGDAASGTPYRYCSWKSGGHAPSLTSNCYLADVNSWALDGNSTCTTSPNWGSHTGAAPGGECVAFGILSGELLYTPYGVLDALTVANAGNRFCIKPLPPNVACEVTLPGVISHGELLQGTSGIAYIDGTVNCGSAPVVTVVGGTDLTLAAGVSTRVTTTVSNATALRVQSDMTVGASTTPGNYSAAIVIAVSPY